jgi:hypothetical protein
MTTGPAHWELLQRCRAVDNQVLTIKSFILIFFPPKVYDHALTQLEISL